MKSQRSHQNLEVRLGNIITFLSVFYQTVNAHNGQFPRKGDDFKALCLALEGATNAIHAIFDDEESIKRMKIIASQLESSKSLFALLGSAATFFWTAISD